MLRLAVERLFIIIGEALTRLRAVEPAIAAQIPDLPGIIGFRNQLVHNYPHIDAAEVWKILQNDVPRLREAIDALLAGQNPA